LLRGGREKNIKRRILTRKVIKRRHFTSQEAPEKWFRRRKGNFPEGGYFSKKFKEKEMHANETTSNRRQKGY